MKEEFTTTTLKKQYIDDQVCVCFHHFLDLLFSTGSWFWFCLFVYVHTVLTAADEVYCMCCADRRECEQDPTCCYDGCCRIRPWEASHTPPWPAGHMHAAAAAAVVVWLMLVSCCVLLQHGVRACSTFQHPECVLLGIEDVVIYEWMNKSQQRPWMYRVYMFVIFCFNLFKIKPFTFN
jgi:hypothetical protein